MSWKTDLTVLRNQHAMDQLVDVVGTVLQKEQKEASRALSPHIQM